MDLFDALTISRKFFPLLTLAAVWCAFQFAPSATVQAFNGAVQARAARITIQLRTALTPTIDRLTVPARQRSRTRATGGD